MKEHYRKLSVHGLLPLIVNEGKVRFALLGWDHPFVCVGSPDVLPDAEMDIFVFASEAECRAWKSAIDIIDNPKVEAVLPELKHQRFALLVRHDRPRRRATTLEEAIGLRSLIGKPDPRQVAMIGECARSDAMETYWEVCAKKSYASKWKREIEVLQSMTEADYIKVKPVGGRRHASPRADLQGHARA